MEFHHCPVMPDEVISGLRIRENGIYFDGTLGGGGHSEQIAKRLSGGKLIATDLDSEAIAAASERLKEYSEKFFPVKDNFKNFDAILDGMGIDKIDGFLLDLGISSYQIDNRERGFSYLSDEAELDMRMDRGQSLTAKKVVNEYSEEDLKYILSVYGEERFASKIASSIARERKKGEISTTGQLANIIAQAIPAKFRFDGHPAKKSFQAIRIEVNGELDGLKECLYKMIGRLKKGGRIAVITFHSLEDRIVKQCFKDLATGCVCDKRLPVCVCGRKKEIEILTQKPIVAGSEEINLNPRAKSAKLRIAEKV